MIPELLKACPGGIRALDRVSLERAQGMPCPAAAASGADR
jgi:hypothetical protein